MKKEKRREQLLQVKTAKEISSINSIIPFSLFVDENHSVYASDTDNHGVMKWVKGGKQGIVVAGRQGQGNSLRQLSYPRAVTVDHLEQVYVADFGNDRMVRWSKASKDGRVVLGETGKEQQPNQFKLSHRFIFRSRRESLCR